MSPRPGAGWGGEATPTFRSAVWGWVSSPTHDSQNDNVVFSTQSEATAAKCSKDRNQFTRSSTIETRPSLYSTKTTNSTSAAGTAPAGSCARMLTTA
ncbi:hypothetical protein V496_00736 [Pseudogymnoascus sp. VKM F-4515 (FW-2607)]|nr:hypothetical protein V496_00736 [Pseudogymnoascus sp. VKM F-4515 (FW-2607)]